MMAIAEQLAALNDTWDSIIAIQPSLADEEYDILDPTEFYEAVVAFESLDVSEDSEHFEAWLDLRIKIGKVLAYLKDKPLSNNIKLVDYNFSKNTIELAKEIYGSENNINELYSLNNVNTDFELLTGEKVIIPDVFNLG